MRKIQLLNMFALYIQSVYCHWKEMSLIKEKHLVLFGRSGQPVSKKPVFLIWCFLLQLQQNTIKSAPNLAVIWRFYSLQIQFAKKFPIEVCRIFIGQNLEAFEWTRGWRSLNKLLSIMDSKFYFLFYFNLVYIKKSVGIPHIIRLSPWPVVLTM